MALPNTTAVEVGAMADTRLLSSKMHSALKNAIFNEKMLYISQDMN
jgi:hypothetical protein